MVDILLATYNGERYLRDQLDSLLRQTYPDIRIVIRDDGSTDGTMSILKDYKLHHAEKIELVQDEVSCGSPTKNFLELLKHSTAQYVMFCDQDDVWFDRKVERMLLRMQAEEKKAKDGAEPLLVYSDYEVTDGNLHPVAIREKDLQIACHYNSFNRLLVQNYVTGCTMMLNKTASQLAGDYDPRMQMHDWWIALYVSALGQVVYMPEKLMYYRQHGDNDVGAKNVRSLSYIWSRVKDPAIRQSAETCYEQARLLYERHYAEMPVHSREILDDFLSIPSYPKWKRIRKLVDGGYLKGNLLRALGQMCFV